MLVFFLHKKLLKKPHKYFMSGLLDYLSFKISQIYPQLNLKTPFSHYWDEFASRLAHYRVYTLP